METQHPRLHFVQDDTHPFAASHHQKIENQYPSSAAVRDALTERLRRRNGPEIVIILPRETGNWL
jgi:hypothetical protein